MGQVPVALIKQFADLLRRGRVWLSFLLGMSIMMGIFMVIPSLAPYILGNLKFPREQFGMLYFVGGVCTFGGSFLVGRLVDRFGAILIGSLGSLWLAVSMYMLMVHPLGYYGIVAWFAAFMMSSSFRSVPYQTLISKVPHPSQRAQFMSLQSTVAHLSSASGAFLASLILSENAEGALVHVEVLVYVAITISLTSPLLMYLVGRRETPAA
jgi:predicted MFS family arabinose efflux permease